jgi:hydroxyacylglutathione hydrolase
MFHRAFEEGLAQSSYVLACDRTRRAVIVDPRRDIDVYLELGRQHDLILTHAIETHVHADFVSGARELSARGIRTIAGPGAGLGFDHHEATDGDSFSVGDITLKTLHTPGHTPEHISVLVQQPGERDRVFTGDTLFVGAVGRPDLLGGERARALAGELYASLAEKLMVLADDVEVHPGHGAGSLCGTAIGSAPHSTIGQERNSNPWLQHRSMDSFVRAVLGDLPETPPYFAELKRLNQLGPPVLGLGQSLPDTPALAPEAAAEAIKTGALLIDLRQPEAFASGHPAGAINIGFGTKIGYWAGWIVPVSTPIVLLNEGDGRQLADARRQLLRVGIDRVLGYVSGGFSAWRAARLPIAELTRMSARDFHEKAAHSDLVTLVDVRTRQEFDQGHIAGAVNLPVGTLLSRASEIPRHLPVATVCEAGYRSSLAASLLARAGFGPIINLAGGMTAYRTVETPATSEL